MTLAYYAKYRDGHHGVRDRIGGLPSHLPSMYPSCQGCGKPLRFIMQIYVDDKELFEDDWLALQLYDCPKTRCLANNELIVVSLDAKPNSRNEGVPYPQIEPREITWIKRDDPDPSLHEDNPDSYWDDGAFEAEYPYIHDDKLGGCFAWFDHGGTTAYQLGCIGQFRSPTVCSMVYLFNNSDCGLHYYYT